MIDWDDFRVFLAVARAKNITRAARQLGINHSIIELLFFYYLFLFLLILIFFFQAHGCCTLSSSK